LIDSRIYVEDVIKSNSKRFLVPDEHSLQCNDIVDANDPNRHIAYTNTWKDIVLQKKIKKRDKKFDKLEVRELTKDFQHETRYMWNSDPAKQGKEVFDSGEIKELDRPWQKDAVIRDSKRGLIRVSTGRPVYWSEPLGKWMDLVKEDRSEWK
jgi:hypothetical protein